MKPFNCVETIAILVGKQISSKSFEKEITDLLILQVKCVFKSCINMYV